MADTEDDKVSDLPQLEERLKQLKKAEERFSRRFSKKDDEISEDQIDINDQEEPESYLDKTD